MIRLPTSEPRRVDLSHGVTVTHRPVTSTDIWSARQASIAAAAPRVTFAKEVARAVILSIDGVEAPDGTMATADPEVIDALVDLYPLLEAFEVLVIGPALTLDAEKNASSPSPPGTSAGVQITAADATASVPSARGA